MAMQTPHDIPLQIIVLSDPNDQKSKLLVSAERRITPSWSVSTLKSKLESVTGIPSSSQTLRTKSLDNTWITLSPEDALVGDSRFGLNKGSEIEVVDSRPPGSRSTIDFSDVGSVEKYIMPEQEYEKLDDSVLAWKKRQQLGRFAPAVGSKSQPELVAERRAQDAKEVQRRGVVVGQRCRVNQSDERRGVVKFVGEVEGLGSVKEEGWTWVGVEFDEPVGRNDGSVEVEAEQDGKKRKTKRQIFECKGRNYGGLVRPDKIDVGAQWGVIDDLASLEEDDMEEI